MPQSTLKFNLPEEREELNIALRAGEYHSALYEISQIFRKYRKHYDFKSIATRKFFDELDQEICELLNDVLD